MDYCDTEVFFIFICMFVIIVKSQFSDIFTFIEFDQFGMCYCSKLW